MLCSLALTLSLPAAANPRWIWDSDFGSEQRAQLQDWIRATDAAMQRLLGPLNYDYIVHFNRHPGGNEPVPWAETDKGSGRRAIFHVDLRYSWEQLANDWTAPHELSHLMFPYLGERSRWFAEGIASYLQYQIMYAGHVLPWEQAINRYQQRFERARRVSDQRSIVGQSDRGGGDYARLYWGGAAYFLEVDRRLWEQQQLRIADILARYRDCCYQPWGINADGLIRQLNQLSASRIFSQAYTATVAQPGFPATADNLIWLRAHPPPLAAGGD